MHELGVVFYVVKDVKKVAEKNHVEKVSSVTLEIGEVSGILHDYLTDCWNWAKKKEPLMEEAELKIEQIEAVTFCDSFKSLVLYHLSKRLTIGKTLIFQSDTSISFIKNSCGEGFFRDTGDWGSVRNST